jgi:uncharacterized protein YhdP
MRLAPAAAAAATDTPAAVRSAAPGARRLVLRVTLATLGGALLLAAVALFIYALAAARVPEHRAALEELLRAETGLEVRFSELGLRWGWYGPEAVFRGVELGEPGEARTLLTAPQLVVGVDLWRMLRSGELQIGRITLVEPDIDLTPAPAARAPRSAREGVRADPARLLARWRGVRIDVEGGTLHTAAAGAPLAVGIRRIALRRSGAEWSAQALLTLPPALGATAEALATLHGDAAHPSELSGTLSVSGSRLEFSGWRALLGPVPAAEYLPRAGSGNVTLQLELAHGDLVGASGSVQAQALEWPAAGDAGAGLALERLHAGWHLTRARGGWHLAVEPIELAGAASAGGNVTVDAASDGRWVRGRVARIPVMVLAGLARSFAPELSLAEPALGGLMSEARFDWSADRGEEPRLTSTVELRDLTLSPPGSGLRLAGLAAHVSGDGSHLSADVHSDSARLTVADDPTFALGSLAVSARLELEHAGHAWRVSTPNLDIHDADTRLTLTGALAGEDSGRHPRLDARATLNGMPVELLRAILGARALAALGPAAAGLTAGRIEHAELVAHGPLDQPLPWSAARGELSGSLTLSGASLAAGADWPALRDLSAHIDWRGARVRARVDQAVTGGIRLTAASGEWDARDAQLTRLSARLAGNAAEALAWLRDHPQLAPVAPGLGSVDLRGQALFNVDLRRVAAVSGSARASRYATRITALLDDAQLRPVGGFPAVEALRGTLLFAAGRLQRSTINGQWLGGPIALSVAERRERGAAVITVTGRGQLDARQALLAATGGSGEGSPLEGSAEWSADLKLVPAAGAGEASWRVRADSSLVGVASRLPEPLAKSAVAPLAAHLDLSGNGDAGNLRLALGELRALVAVKRRGDLWQIERGALSLAGSTPALPADPVVRVEGKVTRLDLAAYAGLWRALAHNPVWPALRIELTAGEMLAAGRSFTDVSLMADSAADADRLQLESADLDGTVRWPATVDAAHPVIARLSRLDLPDVGVMAALGPATLASVDDLRWRGRSLGALTATFTSRAGAVDVSDAHLTGAGGEAQGTFHCREGRCRATFQLESHDAAATLARLGFRPDLSASRALVSGTLDCPVEDGAAALAGTTGLLHVELDDGVTHGAPADAAQGAPLGLLAVPGLIAAMGLPELRFTRLTADFAVGDGQAYTSDVHLDGDTEILMRGRIGLIAQDYDAQVWVLKGEERLPAAVRRLGPGPRVAALWLSLRDLFSGSNRERAALRLRGTWNAPMVTEP